MWNWNIKMLKNKHLYIWNICHKSQSSHIYDFKRGLTRQLLIKRKIAKQTNIAKPWIWNLSSAKRPKSERSKASIFTNKFWFMIKLQFRDKIESPTTPFMRWTSVENLKYNLRKIIILVLWPFHIIFLSKSTPLRQCTVQIISYVVTSNTKIVSWFMHDIPCNYTFKSRYISSDINYQIPYFFY